jgi:beta-lactamase regulating signal transducer with metallopeptidase domain
MLAWMVYATLAAAALGVTAWLIDFAAAGRFRRRRVVWAGVLLASAVGPIVFSATRGISTAVVAEADVHAEGAASGWREAPMVSDRMLGSAWLAASAVIALWLVANQRRLRRRLSGYRSRIVDGERVLVSSEFGPAVVGVVRPQIVLPEWALAIGESDRRIIVAHETEHRQAHDPLLAALALIAVAALPWNAALWWQLRRLRLAIEIDCDQRVISRHGHDPHAYGMLLLAARERAARVTPALAMAMAAMRSELGRRVEALVNGRPRSAVRRLSALAAAVVLAAGIVSVPAPRLSMVHAAVVEPSAAVSPMLPALTSTQLDSLQTPTVGPLTPKVVGPTRQGRRESRESPDHGPSSAASTAEGLRDTASAVSERRLVRYRVFTPRGESEPRIVLDSGAPEIRVVLPSADPNRSIRVVSTAPTRMVLPPIPDSLRPPPL